MWCQSLRLHLLIDTLGHLEQSRTSKHETLTNEFVLFLSLWIELSLELEFFRQSILHLLYALKGLLQHHNGFLHIFFEELSDGLFAASCQQFWEFLDFVLIFLPELGFTAHLIAEYLTVPAQQQSKNIAVKTISFFLSLLFRQLLFLVNSSQEHFLDQVGNVCFRNGEPTDKQLHVEVDDSFKGCSDSRVVRRQYHVNLLF